MPNALAHRPMRRLVESVLVAAALLLVAGCGSSEGIDDGSTSPVSDGPRVADSRFDGSFEIVELEIDGTPVALKQRPSMEIEARFGALTVLPGCNTNFGSFSLDSQGGASFTVTGGSDLDCGELGGQEEAILAGLAAVDQWLATDDGFRFEGPGSSVSVVGPAG